MIGRFDIALEQATEPADAVWRRPEAPFASGPVTARATRLARLVRIALHLAHGVLIAALVFPCVDPARRREHVRLWAQQLLGILSVHLRISGARPEFADTPLMLVANHVSWLDVIAISAVMPVRFVAKSEMRAWPVIGWLGERAGTLFIRRARRHDTARIGKKLAHAMRCGDAVAVFPEATTSDGTTVLKFHSSLLQSAVLAGATLRPVAVRYARADGTWCLEATYDGSKTLWDSLKLMLSQPHIVAELAFLSPIESGGRHRRDLACAAREAILQSLFPPARGSRIETGGGLQAAAR